MESLTNDFSDSLWPLSKVLLKEILDDHISDTFLAKLVWERLGYKPANERSAIWEAGPTTPEQWKKAFPLAPQIIVQRQASVQLTRSIKKEFKQLLKEKLQFKGYLISELYPRRTRRATAVNWLLAWIESQSERLVDEGPLPQIFVTPDDPSIGHPGDPSIE